ncbi:MAG TPA: tetratricopeptide repeat protein [Streptosporangiaceae bacterium]|nr:tetratricopeptide repeat protein [Streptosporangiaceae bacterium]
MVSISGSRSDEPPAPRPAQLPPDVADFTGRGEQLDQLLELLRPGSTDQAVVITALAGMAGVGKTALAVHAAHRLRERFPDGQLYVDLRGADQVPLEPAGVLARMLRTLGVARPPDTLEERVDLFRSRLADRAVLLLLDNAVTEPQVRPLLPGSPSCGVIVTSRNHLAGLAGVRLIDIDVFEPAQAIELLARIVGADRVAAEPAAAERIVRLCGYLPLAVRIAGARLAAKPHWSLTRLVERLDDEHRRLDELSLGDLEVRAGMTLSYEALDPAARRALRLLGLLDVPSIAAWVAGAVLGVPPAGAEDLIERLVEAQLLEVTGENGTYRYRFHDLIRVLARERAEAEDSPAERQTAVRRAFAGWLTVAEEVDARLPSTALGVVRGPVPRWYGQQPLIHDPLAWFESERACLVAAVGQACRLGFADLAWELAQTLTDFLDLRGSYDEWRQTHERALQVVRKHEDRLGEAVLLRGLAQLGTYTRPPAEYLHTAETARALFAELGVQVGESDALWLCAHAHRSSGDLDRALTYLQAALDLAVRAGHHTGEAFAWKGFGEVRREQGQLVAAMECFERCLTLWRRLGRSRHVAMALHDLGLVHGELGQDEASARRLREALTLFRTLGDRLSEAGAHHSLGELDLRQGRVGEAAGHLRQALRLWRELDVPYRESQTRRLLDQAEQAIT